MSFNRDVGFRYLSSSPSQKEGAVAFRRKKSLPSDRKLYRSQSELTLNDLDHNKQLFDNDNLSDVDASLHSHSSVPACNRIKNRTLSHPKHISSFHDHDNDDSENDHHDHERKRLKSKKKNKKHKRAVVTPGFSQIGATTSLSCWDNNNNSADHSPPIKDDVPNNWMPLFLPSYKSRLSKFQRTFEEIPPNEKLVDDYVCALRKDILLQGRLYISVNYIAFHSNILGYETILTIKFSDVTRISKATTMKVFPNAIEIHTVLGEKHILTSFVSRERCYALMIKLWQNSHDVHDSSGQKITWTEICKYIRNSYITDNLPHDLSELDELDLEKHILKGKSVTKKLQNKKEKMKLLEVERSHQRSDSAASFLSAFEDLPNDNESPGENKALSLDSNNNNNFDDDNNISHKLHPTSDSSNSQDSISRIVPGFVMDSIQYCFDEKHIVRVCVIISIVLLFVQLFLFCWVTLFENKINNYERFLVDTIAARRSQLQQHSILTDSV